MPRGEICEMKEGEQPDEALICTVGGLSSFIHKVALDASVQLKIGPGNFIVDATSNNGLFRIINISSLTAVAVCTLVHALLTR